jgi:Bacterial virulence protein (VirJ)
LFRAASKFASHIAVAAIVLMTASPNVGRASPLASKPGQYAVSRSPVKFGARSIHATYVEPTRAQHPGYFIVFITGDGGWHGTSSRIFQHLADDGYSVAGFSAPEILRPVRRSGQRVRFAVAAQRYAQLFAQARRDLGVGTRAGMIVVGFSRGASVVAFAAVSRTLRTELVGAVAIALTRETDYLRAPEPADREPELHVDAKDRIQLYPALKLIGSTPLAVIQSTNDRYVPSAESRELLGPDTPTRRLYEVPARNHRFKGGDDTLLRDLDGALDWIESLRAASSGR